ncbi:MAG TPA: hypothetical protein VJ986_03405 [Gaiellaceae bacterium]|nr:hypothetical protein [Gaiellaceae bacterium]
MRLLHALLRRRRRPAPPLADADRLLRIYRETQAEMEQLRRAA